MISVSIVCFIENFSFFSADQVVYSVAHEGSRLEIPEGPLGRLISGPCNFPLLHVDDRTQLSTSTNYFGFVLSAECWAECHQRPSCEEILSRLVDIEYSLC